MSLGSITMVLTPKYIVSCTHSGFYHLGIQGAKDHVNSRDSEGTLV